MSDAADWFFAARREALGLPEPTPKPDVPRDSLDPYDPTSVAFAFGG